MAQLSAGFRIHCIYMAKVRPKGWIALLIFAVCIDFIQALVGLLTLPFFLIGIGVNIILSISVQSFLFIWSGHNNIPSQFEHRLVTRLLVILGEWLPFLQWFPFWSLYALTYHVEEEETLPQYKFSDVQVPQSRR